MKALWADTSSKRELEVAIASVNPCLHGSGSQGVGRGGGSAVGTDARIEQKGARECRGRRVEV